MYSKVMGEKIFVMPPGTAPVLDTGYTGFGGEYAAADGKKIGDSRV
ncbi:MAG: hypothetical protein LBK44_00635 [Spirochaetales bacterium]|nr:hypothetical protein [Spirochaetales bacterium]